MNALNNESQTESSMTSVRDLQDRSTSASLAINRHITHSLLAAVLSEIACGCFHRTMPRSLFVRKGSVNCLRQTTRQGLGTRLRRLIGSGWPGAPRVASGRSA